MAKVRKTITIHPDGLRVIVKEILDNNMTVVSKEVRSLRPIKGKEQKDDDSGYNSKVSYYSDEENSHPGSLESVDSNATPTEDEIIRMISELSSMAIEIEKKKIKEDKSKTRKMPEDGGDEPPRTRRLGGDESTQATQYSMSTTRDGPSTLVVESVTDDDILKMMQEVSLQATEEIRQSQRQLDVEPLSDEEKSLPEESKLTAVTEDAQLIESTVKETMREQDAEVVDAEPAKEEAKVPAVKADLSVFSDLNSALNKADKETKERAVPVAEESQGSISPPPESDASRSKSVDYDSRSPSGSASKSRSASVGSRSRSRSYSSRSKSRSYSRSPSRSYSRSRSRSYSSRSRSRSYSRSKSYSSRSRSRSYASRSRSRSGGSSPPPASDQSPTPESVAQVDAGAGSEVKATPADPIEPEVQVDETVPEPPVEEDKFEMSPADRSRAIAAILNDKSLSGPERQEKIKTLRPKASAVKTAPVSQGQQEDPDAAARRRAIQAVHSNTALTPQEKHKQIQDLLSGAMLPDAGASAPAVTEAAQTGQPNIQPPSPTMPSTDPPRQFGDTAAPVQPEAPVRPSIVEIKKEPSATSVITGDSGLDRIIRSEEREQERTARNAAIQEIYKDDSLDPKQKQEKIRLVLEGKFNLSGSNNDKEQQKEKGASLPPKAQDSDPVSPRSMASADSSGKRVSISDVGREPSAMSFAPAPVVSGDSSRDIWQSSKQPSFRVTPKAITEPRPTLVQVGKNLSTQSAITITSDEGGPSKDGESANAIENISSGVEKVEEERSEDFTIEGIEQPPPPIPAPRPKKSKKNNLPQPIVRELEEDEPVDGYIMPDEDAEDLRKSITPTNEALLGFAPPSPINPNRGSEEEKRSETYPPQWMIPIAVEVALTIRMTDHIALEVADLIEVVLARPIRMIEVDHAATPPTVDPTGVAVARIREADHAATLLMTEVDHAATPLTADPDLLDQVLHQQAIEAKPPLMMIEVDHARTPQRVGPEVPIPTEADRARRHQPVGARVLLLMTQADHARRLQTVGAKPPLMMIEVDHARTPQR
ncbi:MAG: hypothetical protein SGBAC_009312, partial [Bacillariaceae sp.]